MAQDTYQQRSKRDENRQRASDSQPNDNVYATASPARGYAMGSIEEIYEDLDADDISESEFREAVADKVDQMGGLADEETAAMLIAHELADTDVETVADIEAGLDEVAFVAKVLSIGDLRTFERDGDDEDGRVLNVEAADETGAVRLAFWDRRAEAVAEGDIEVGDVLRIRGRPKDGYNGIEVSVDDAELDTETEIAVEPGDGANIDSLTLGQSDVTLQGLVLETGTVRTFDRDDGTEGRVSNISLGDETGRIRVTLWDDKADRATELDPGTTVEVVDGYVRERDGSLELHVGDRGAVDEIDDKVDFEPESTPIADVELDETVDIAGVVRSSDPTRTFDRDDGSEGQVRNIRLQDESDDIRVALWGDLADKDIQPGDEVFAADVDIQEGWQDDLEASANWQSTVVVLEDGSTAPPEPTPETDADAATLETFSDGGDAAVEGEETEFTGTVVQTGQPVVLDDGSETVTVSTDERLQLGEEVTVRGELRNGRLDADEVL